jgi:ankyrin repeat protein
LFAFAGENGASAALFRFAVEKGANPNVARTDEPPALHAAAAEGNVQRVKLLLELGANPELEVTPASGGGYLGVGTALSLAAERGQLDVARLLLANGSSIEGGPVAQAWGAPLFRACLEAREPLPMIELLLSHGANPNLAPRELEKTPLHAASERGATEVARRLFAHGASPTARDEIGRTPLHNACEIGDARLVDLLLKSGADPRATDDDGATPFDILEESSRDAEVYRLFEAHGFRAVASRQLPGDANDHRDHTALHRAVESGDVGRVRQLLERGADPNAVDGEGNGALHVVVSSRPSDAYLAGPVATLVTDGRLAVLGQISERVQAARLLIATGAKVDLQNRVGRTPLHLAALTPAEPALLGLLLEKGADCNAIDGSDKTPLELARHAELQRILRAAGARSRHELGPIPRRAGRLILT